MGSFWPLFFVEGHPPPRSLLSADAGAYINHNFRTRGHRIGKLNAACKVQCESQLQELRGYPIGVLNPARLVCKAENRVTRPGAYRNEGVRVSMLYIQRYVGPSI